MVWEEFKSRILFVDDDEDLPLVAKELLTTREPTFEFVWTTSPLEALRMLKEEQFDIVVSDYQIPDMSGLELFKRIRSENNTIPFILFTGRSREEVAIEALNLGVNHYIHKAGDPRSNYAELAYAIKSLIEHKETKDALRQIEEKLRLVYRQRTSSLCRTFFHGMVPKKRRFHDLRRSSK